MDRVICVCCRMSRGELLMNWEVIDTKASNLTMEKEDFLYNLWVDAEKSSIIRLVKTRAAQLIAGT